MATDTQLHPAEHRAYRELYASCRQLIRRWGRLGPALEGTPLGPPLERGVEETKELLGVLRPRTAAYGLHGEPMAQGVGARVADFRAAVADRGGDTGMVARFAVLDVDHLTTLLRQLAELARARQDRDLAGFCEEWAGRFEAQLGAVREAAVGLGSDPERAAAPLSGSLVNRAAHGAGWVAGSVGEAVDRAIGRRRSR